MTGYERLARPALFRIGGGDAEAAHEWTLRRLAWLARHPVALAALRRWYAVPAPRTVFGLRFANPVGLAAGVDKDGVALGAWPALGFGFVEVGTVTRYAQPGNPRPRLHRLPGSRAIVNAMGFNNAGAAALAARLATQGGLQVPLGVSLGKSRVTPMAAAVDDYVASLVMLRDHADYVAVNVSSPNTPGLRGLQQRDHLGQLLTALREVAAGRPILVKIAPDLADHAIGEVLEVCADRGAAGIIATNSTLARDELAPGDAVRAAAWPGGVSGAPLTRRTRDVVTFLAKRSELPVVGVGGVLDPDDATRLFDAGASLVQLYTGLVYRGPGLVRAIARTAARPD